ncbi:MAG TPA: hypothetical protein VHE33_19420, partial [Acidobacteriaceae bacterium]|nr:hypothetical protein [Acidobacteriaceae bacterium]
MTAKKATRAAKKNPPNRATKKAPEKKKAGRGAAGGVEDYIAGIPESSRKTFDALRAAARQAAP